jgi:hypothetical protein
MVETVAGVIGDRVDRRIGTLRRTRAPEVIGEIADPAVECVGERLGSAVITAT